MTSFRVPMTVLLLSLAAVGQTVPATTQPAARPVVPPSAIDGVYLGKLGDDEIVLEIGESRADQKLSFGNAEGADDVSFPVMGRYFFRREGVARLVVGQRIEDGGVALREYHGWSGENVNGSIRLRENEYLKPTGGAWRLVFDGEGGNTTGFFCKCDVTAKKAPRSGLRKIVLKRATRDFQPGFADLEGGRDTRHPIYYDLLLESPLEFSPEVQTGDASGYVMWSDPRFKVSVVRVTRFPRAKALIRINDDAANRLRVARITAAQYSQGEYFAGGEWSMIDSVTFMSPELVNIVSRASYIPGGGLARSESVSVLSYDARTGEPFDFYGALRDQMDRDVLRQHVGDTADCAGDCTASQQFRALLVQLYRSHYAAPSAACKSIMAAEAGDKNLLSDAEMDVWPAKEGIVIRPDLHAANSACATEVTVPYAEILPNLNKDSSLREMIVGPPPVPQR